MKSPKVFTLEEANGLVPRLEALFERWTQKKENYERLHDELFMHELIAQALPEERRGGQIEREAQDLDRSISGLESEIREIRGLGCVVRNLERGWVDFPGIWDGKTVYFCWKRGEKTIQFYHPVRESPGGRLPIMRPPA